MRVAERKWKWGSSLHLKVVRHALATVQLQPTVSYMNFNDIDEIKKAGFIGFKTMSELFLDSSSISNSKGVYFILYIEKKAPEFLNPGTGPPFYKGKNPNVCVSKLQSNWVDDTIVVYIGKGGGIYRGKESKETLRSRLKDYFSFGGNCANFKISQSHFSQLFH